ncbi:flippase [Natrinema longum]|uniref:Flippase n=1 Tax=Natrinema longum TaxID=370324 RepID=A0A8A2UAZ2_9EURY|nr:flippase [Natrinema longum]MBZ6496462.1 flippase [Natrinema longum]QSW85632.1 flippase [Natrinema longum]
MKKSLLRLMSVAFFGSLVGRGLRYLLNVVIARGLGPEALGLFAFGMVIMKAFSVLSRFGLDTAARKYVPVYNNQGDKAKLCGISVLSIAFPFFLGIIISIIVFVVLRTGNFGPEFAPTASLFVAGIPLFSSMMVAQNATTGFKETRYAVYIRDIIQSSTAILFIAIGALYFKDLNITIYGYIASFGIGLLSAVYFLSRLGAFQSYPELELKKILAFSAPLVVVAVAQYIVSWTDIFMLAIFVSPTEVGWYQAAYQTSVLLVLVLSAVNSIFPAVASDLYSSDQLKTLDQIYSTATKWVSYLTVLGFVFISIFSREVLLLFGTSTESARISLIILAFGQTITASTGPVGFLLTMSGHERLESINTVFLAISNIVLNFILIQSFGIIGASIATATSLLALNLIRIVEAYHLLGIQPYEQSYWKGCIGILASSIFMILVYRFASGSIIPTSVVGTIALVLFLSIMVLLGFDTQDQKLIEAIK